MAKSIFSFFFADTTSGSETGSKNDGKGNAELVSMGNEEAAQQIQLASNKTTVKGKDKASPEQEVSKNENRKTKPSRTETSAKKDNKKANSRPSRAARERAIEVSTRTKKAKDTLYDARKATINPQSKVKTIKEFIEHLPNETQDVIKADIKRKVKNKDFEYDSQIRQVEKTPDKEAKERLSKRELLEQKRGIYRREQTALRLAKAAAEKARAMVKAVRERVLNKLRGKKPATVQQQPNVQTQTQNQNQNKDMSKYISNMRDNTK